MLSLVNSDFSIIQGQFWPRADMAALGQSEKIILEKVLNNNFANQWQCRLNFINLIKIFSEHGDGGKFHTEPSEASA